MGQGDLTIHGRSRSWMLKKLREKEVETGSVTRSSQSSGSQPESRHLIGKPLGNMSIYIMTLNSTQITAMKSQ